MRAIGFGVTVAGLVLAGGLHAQQFMFQAPGAAGGSRAPGKSDGQGAGVRPW